MAEQIGTIVKAGDELKKDESGMVFKMGVDKYTYSLFTPALIATAKENLGNRVKVTYTMSDDGKYRNVQAIELAKESEESTSPQPKKQWGKPPEEQADIRQQVAVYVVKDLFIADKLREDHPRVIAMNAWLGEQLPGKIPAPVRTVPRESVKESEGEPKSALEHFKEECKRYGWDAEIQGNQRAISAWLKEEFGVGWKDLTDEAQEQAVKQMRQLADEKAELGWGGGGRPPKAVLPAPTTQGNNQ